MTIDTATVCGKARSTLALFTSGMASIWAASDEASTLRRLLPATSCATATRTSASTFGVAPVTATCEAAKIDEFSSADQPSGSSTIAIAPASTASRRRPSDRRSARRRSTSTGSTWAAAMSIQCAGRRADPAGLRRRFEPDRPEHLHLVLELDAEPLAGPPPRLLHQRDHVGGAGIPCVLDEVRVHRRDPGATGREALQPALLEDAPGGEVAARVLPHRPERAHLGRLGLAPAPLHVGDGRPDPLRVVGPQPQHRLGDDLARADVRAPVAHAELVRPARPFAAGADHHGAVEHVAQLAAVGARVHPHRAA